MHGFDVPSTVHDAGGVADAIFELTVAAALGAGAERLEVGLSLLGRRR